MLSNCCNIKEQVYANIGPKGTAFLTRELRACARVSYRYDVGNAIRSLARSLDWSIPVNFF